MKNSHYIYGILFILLFFSIASCGGEKIEWQGSIEEDNGIPVVKNPKEPIYTEDIVNFEEELVITEGEGKQYLFSNLIDLAVNDDETLYALDYQTADIKVFDKDGQYIKTFGKRGQGPGEPAVAPHVRTIPASARSRRPGSPRTVMRVCQVPFHRSAPAASMDRGA